MKIQTAEQLLEKLTVEKANINTYQAQLGFSNDDEQECTQDFDNLQAAIANTEIADADKKSVTKVKNEVFNGDEDENIEPYPSFALTPLPHPGVNAGALSRYNNRKGRAKLAAGYTEQIGIAMGYASVAAGKIPSEQVKPQIEAHAAATGYLFGIIVSGRADATMWEVQIRRKGQETWATVQSATGKSADVTITPTTPGEAEQIQVRVVLKKNNHAYGQPSDPTYVTVNP